MNISNRFYRVEKNSLVFPGIDREKLTIGDIYNISGGLITEGYRGNVRQLYFYEYSNPGHNVFIMTNKKGSKQFAVETNDCIRDKFPANCLAKVLVEEGNFIIHVFPEYSSEKKFTGQHVVNIFEVIELSPKVNYSFNSDLSINVILRDKKVLSTHYGIAKFGDAINHALLVSRRKTDDCTTPKYCFNPGRVINNRLFHRDEDGELVSYADNGKKLILNRHSPEGIVTVNGANRRVENIFLRCFFSKKLINEDVIFVDGAQLSMLQKDELNDYIEKSSLTKSMASTIIKKLITHHGQDFFVVVNVKGEIRPIYKNSYGYATFPLNEREQSFIRTIEDLKF